MNTIKYGEELLKTGDLTWKRNDKQYQDALNLNFLMEWPTTSNIFDRSYSGEEIIFISAKKRKYKTPLHFAWRIIFFFREYDNKADILETIAETDFIEIVPENTISIIWRASQKWSVKYKQLLPEITKSYSVWNDGLDIYLVFEDNQYFYAWNWSSTA